MHLKTQSIKIRKGLYLYKQPQSKGRGSPNWYARVYLHINGRPAQTKSSGTTDERAAARFAEDYYIECLFQRKLAEQGFHSPIGIKAAPVHRFDRIADRFLEKCLADAGSDDRAIRRARDHKAALLGRGGLAVHFKDKDVNSIQTAEIRDYLAFQVEMSRDGELAPATQKRTLSSLSQVLKFAHEQRHLSSLPRLPGIKLQDNPRPWLEKQEYQRLYRTAYGLAHGARRRGAVEEFRYWQELGDFIVFMVGSYLRPSEWKDLRHQHVEPFDDGKNRGLILKVSAGKTGYRESVTMPALVGVYERITARVGPKPTTHLFVPQYQNRQTAMKQMRLRFNELLDRTGLRTNIDGLDRTMYSLRHTALMLRITHSDRLDSFILARNAGTSVEMLSRFYLKRLNNRLSIEDLQSFRRR
ncbi:tyrosine-type recombinase/integrase [Sphingomonas tabacisoli]|uniref:Tyrosine-type recombinase/integrase n=1 Tax=Sphingomonas tabacisoli TaxID=2249466 RepID=A0ABW4I2J9_9SPHN